LTSIPTRQMTRTVIVLLTLAATSTSLLGQTQAAKDEAGAYLIPFDKKGNMIELAVANNTPNTYEHVEVRLSNTPTWLSTTSTKVALKQIGSKDEALAEFTFSTDDSAPTEERETLTFEVFSGNELVATKTIDISVELPKELTLRGNYPNPFNPTTTIGFVQPEDGDIALEIFDSIGRRVDLLSKTGAKSGQQTFRWNASSRATGVYFYRLELRGESGERQARLGKMMLIK
jgi:hypothetical protein